MPGAGPLASSLPSHGALAAWAAGALIATVALALVMRRRHDALPLLVVLALPFRVPIAAEGRTVNLLVPLYVVIAAGTIVYLLPRARALLAGGARRERAALPDVVRWLLWGSVALYALQLGYSADRVKAAENIAFFYVPFALLFVLLSQVRWTRALLARCLCVAVALAVVFAGVGFVEYARKELFLNPKVVAANQYDNYFRVNSVFFDPNIYGRFLALVMIAVTHGGAVEPHAARGADRRGAARVAPGRPRDELLAVEHRRAAAGARGARGVALGRARHRVRVRGPRWRSARRSCCSRRRACTSG